MRHADAPTRAMHIFATRSASPRSAFTLVELVVCITTGAIIAGTAGMMLLNATHQRSEIAARCQLADTGGAALELMLRYLREIRQDECPSDPTPCLEGNAQVTTAAASELQFDEFGFRLNGTDVEITRDTAGTWHPLARDVTSLSFTYYDSNGAAITPLPLTDVNDRNDIRRITIDLELARGGQTVRLRCAAYVRNFMNEVENEVP